MTKITTNTSITELAVLVSQALEDADITATLSGGGAVTLYSENEYLSKDLDFVTAASHKVLSDAISHLGFTESSNTRQFEHPLSEWYVEFPPSPLGFGDLILEQEDIPLLTTKHGQLRVITPTLSVMDRLSACWYHNDYQCWDQAIMVAKNQSIDWEKIYKWTTNEGQSKSDIDQLRKSAEEG